jgi:phosphonate transport system substrate-binding protein
MKLSRFWLCLLLWISGLAAANPSTVPATPQSFSFGIIPQQTPAAVRRQWTPILEELSRRSGYRLDLKIATDIPAFEKNVAAGNYDFIYINPYLYTVYHRAPRYDAFARQEEGLRGLIVVHRDSPFQTLSDLRARTVAFTPAAFAATVVPLAELRKQRISVLRDYVGAHDEVYQAVADGTHAAGGGVPQTLEQSLPAIRNQLRVLWSSNAYTSHAFAAHPRVPRPVVERLQQAMTSLSADTGGRALLKATGLGNIVGARDSDWNDVRGLAIDKLELQWRSPQSR